MTSEAPWNVLPHGPLERLDDGLFRVEGALPNMPMKRVMTIASREDGGLVVHNAIAVDDATRTAIEALGPLRELVVPNGYHRLDAPAFVARYPELTVVAPRGSAKKVREVVRVDATYDEARRDARVWFEHLDGLGESEGVMFVRTASGTTAVLNDAVFNMPHVSGAQGFVLRHVTGSSGGPRVSRLFRLLALKNKAAFRASLERVAATPELVRVIVAHHAAIDDQPAEVLRAVASRL